MLSNRTILVTGGLGRLGRPLVSYLANLGANIVLTTRNPDSAATFNCESRRDGISATAEVLGFENEEDITEFADRVVSEHGPIHGLVNNAYANVPFQPTGSIAWSTWTTTMLVGVAAAETLTSALLADRDRSQLDRVVNISSIYGQRAPHFEIYLEGQDPNPAYYGASKAALESLTRYLAAQHGPNGVRINSVAPGGILGGQDPAFLKRYGATVPLGRMVTTDEVSAVVSQLLGDEVGDRNGEIITIA